MIRWTGGHGGDSASLETSICKHVQDLSSSIKRKMKSKVSKEILNVASATHGEEEVHDAGVQQRFPPGLGRLEHDILCGLKHGDVVAPQ